jgi:hypothetical protein
MHAHSQAHERRFLIGLTSDNRKQAWKMNSQTQGPDKERFTVADPKPSATRRSEPENSMLDKTEHLQ